MKKGPQGFAHWNINRILLKLVCNLHVVEVLTFYIGVLEHMENAANYG